VSKWRRPIFHKRWILGFVAATLAAAPATQPLPPRASAAHPNYTFDPVDPKWYVSVLYLDIEHDRGILPTDPEPKDKCFIDCNYADDDHSPAHKEIIFYPSGKLFIETDLHVHGVDMIVRGDTYTRALKEDGTVIYFDHFHDGKCVEGFSILPDGTKQQVIDGAGSLTQPTPRGDAQRRFFGDGGEELSHIEGKNVFLHHKGGWLHITEKGSEELTLYNSQTREQDEWDRSARGVVSHGSDAALPQDQLKARYLQLRADFFSHLKQCADKGHFTFKDMGIEQYAAAPAAAGG
jgi:hypothetical protein